MLQGIYLVACKCCILHSMSSIDTPDTTWHRMGKGKSSRLTNIPLPLVGSKHVDARMEDQSVSTLTFVAARACNTSADTLPLRVSSSCDPFAEIEDKQVKTDAKHLIEPASANLRTWLSQESAVSTCPTRLSKLYFERRAA